jgi:2-keto-4-pentenoate hydratase
MVKTRMMAIAEIAYGIRSAYEPGKLCPPIRDALTDQDLDTAYGIQHLNTEHWLGEGRRLVGRKIGLTSKAVQDQLGVDQPDYGMLFADMEIADGSEIDFASLQQPRVEAEIAFRLDENLNSPNLTISDVVGAIEYAVPAIEVACSRIEGWNIKVVDTIADNASAGVFVLGTQPVKLDAFDHRLCGMVLEHRGEPVSVGAGAACLGNPLNAVLWLARKMVEVGSPLLAGDIVMSGALGPMVPAKPGEVYEARISGLGSVRAVFSS